LLTSIQKSQDSGAWTSTQISQFAGYKLRIYNLSKAQTTATANITATYRSIVSVLKGFSTNTSFQTLVWSIFIQSWGTINQYIGCNSTYTG
jgi:hypothetical protein